MNYDRHIIVSCIKDPALRRSVFEIRLDMTKADMKLREAVTSIGCKPCERANAA